VNQFIVKHPGATFVSVEEAARFLGISRGLAYSETHRYLAAGEGLCCIRIGNRILVPVAWLEEQAATGCSLLGTRAATG
jgi:hypothetical protein